MSDPKSNESNPMQGDPQKPGGTYKDPVAGLTDAQKLPQLPQAPDPQPFGNMRKVSGGR